MPIKMIPVISDFKKAINYCKFHGEAHPFGNEFIKKTVAFWGLDDEETAYLKKR